MYLSSSIIAESIRQLHEINPFFGISLLAFKKNGLPVGTTTQLVFSKVAQDVLERFYRPIKSSSYFFHPFHTSDRSDRWVKPRYGSTSLQRITTDTFGDCLLHKKKSSEWGWRTDYVRKLAEHLDGKKISAFHLAVWLFRGEPWLTAGDLSTICDRFFAEFYITREERNALYSSKMPSIPKEWLADDPLSEEQLSEIISTPPDVKMPHGAALVSLTIRSIGPADRFKYDPAERLNILTGDNSLGKTFLLETIWWALTNSWVDQIASPQRSSNKTTPSIEFVLGARIAKSQTHHAAYSWKTQSWTMPKRKVNAGLVIYGRHDGSFALFDPARVENENSLDDGSNGTLVFSRQQVWDGLPNHSRIHRSQWLCNGLIRDWVSWQTDRRQEERFNSLASCLRDLSPSSTEKLTPGEPVRASIHDSREIPTLKMPYGEVPITNASAGVQRVVAFAYLLVWAWHEHVALSALRREPPQRRLVLIIDEVEAHLHPLWQRTIVPAIMKVLTTLASSVSPQVHLATHSPLILASAEPIFDEEKDDLHHLRLRNNKVILEELRFQKRGRADLWLVSDVFGLAQARSLPAEEAIMAAKDLQLKESPDRSEVETVHKLLIKLLAPDDDFWPRWTFFANKYIEKL